MCSEFVEIGEGSGFMLVEVLICIIWVLISIILLFHRVQNQDTKENRAREAWEQTVHGQCSSSIRGQGKNRQSVR